ncbi:MAG: S41 family peptidase [Bacteroides sp.]|nr:S41 family peptidase [Bacteroides sp.]MDE6043447.1 S41 family peptidase [Muribaculaceae bacterium]
MRILKAISITILLLAAAACHKVDDYSGGLYGNFDALWSIVDEHYCFFEEKDVDWKEVGERYRAQIDPEGMETTDFFLLCGSMLSELKDGHVNLSSSFNTSYYRRWWSDYKQNFDLRLVQQFYLEFDYAQSGPLSYKVLNDSIGYMRVSTMASGITHGALDVSMLEFAEAGCPALVIDVRDNGGGMMTTTQTLVERFISERTLAGYISHKTGPGHNDFSSPYPFYYDPAEGHVRWLRPVVIVTNRSTFSAANSFVSIMRLLPGVLIVGDTTGGGSGMPFSSEIPCGWGVRMSACPVYDARMNLTEHGVEPSPGCRVDLDPEQALRGKDTILELALALASDWRSWYEKR